MNASCPNGKCWQRIYLFIPFLLFCFLCIILYMRLQDEESLSVPSALIGQSAPDFILPPLNGLIDSHGNFVPGLSTADLQKGETVLVNIWSSWCAPCRREHPVLQQLADEGVIIYGISYKDSPADALYFLNKLGNPFERVGVDSAGSLAIDWGIYGVPETFVVGGDGVVLYRYKGSLSPDMIEQIHLKISGSSK